MNKIFAENSIIVLNIKLGVKKQSIKSIFSRFGEIVKSKTFLNKNNSLMAFIKYNNSNAVENALNYGEINCCGIPLTVRKAYDSSNKNIQNREISDELEEEERQCNCPICCEETWKLLIKEQQEMTLIVRELHGLRAENYRKKILKQVKKNMKRKAREIYKKIKHSI